jgi:hypothetical protein
MGVVRAWIPDRGWPFARLRPTALWMRAPGESLLKRYKVIVNG